MDTPLTEATLAEELHALRERLLLMGARAEQMLAGAMRAALEQNAELAVEIIALDVDVDQDELDVDQRCTAVLGRWQLSGADLRFVIFALKIVTDLERMADLSTSICKRVIENQDAPSFAPFPEVERLGGQVQAVVHLALNAFARRDAAGAEVVLRMDDAVDAIFHVLFRSMIEQMSRGRAHADHAVRVQSIARCLERIGDHATNLAEQVIYLEHGRDVRHRNNPQPS